MSFSKDFYSHSNWIELGKREPYSNLIKPDTPISNIAGKWSRCGYAHISLPISETVFLVPWLLKYFQFWFEWSTVNYTFEKLLSFVSVKEDTLCRKIWHPISGDFPAFLSVFPRLAPVPLQPRGYWRWMNERGILWILENAIVSYKAMSALVLLLFKLPSAVTLMSASTLASSFQTETEKCMFPIMNFVFHHSSCSPIKLWLNKLREAFIWYLGS